MLVRMFMVRYVLFIFYYKDFTKNIFMLTTLVFDIDILFVLESFLSEGWPSG